MFTHEITVLCDGCPTWKRFNATNNKQANQRIRELGWTQPSYGEHYCPGCQ